MTLLKSLKYNIIVFEPSISVQYYDDMLVINDLEEFKKISSIIIANRIDDELNSVIDKVYSRDVFRNN